MDIYSCCFSKELYIFALKELSLKGTMFILSFYFCMEYVAIHPSPYLLLKKIILLPLNCLDTTVEHESQY